MRKFAEDLWNRGIKKEDDRPPFFLSFVLVFLTLHATPSHARHSVFHKTRIAFHPMLRDV
jgi:hypothetical protein